MSGEEEIEKNLLCNVHPLWTFILFDPYSQPLRKGLSSPMSQSVETEAQRVKSIAQDQIADSLPQPWSEL